MGSKGRENDRGRREEGKVTKKRRVKWENIQRR
jgi:hypothetical protein